MPPNRSSSRPAKAGAGVRTEVTTIEAARELGLAVRSVQLMVDRGDLQAWKTPGGHRRISRQSLDRWRAGERRPAAVAAADDVSQVLQEPVQAGEHLRSGGTRPRLLVIEDSTHFQNLIALLLRQSFPQVEVRTASDGIVGLAMVGEFQPDVLLVDILLPGIDGATLVTSLRSHPQFRHLQVIVITSLAPEQQADYAFALTGIPVVHKPRLVAELPPLLTRSLAIAAEARDRAVSVRP